MRRKKIGIKDFCGSVDITDPCYDQGVWCRMNSVPIKPGKYTCIIWRQRERYKIDGEPHVSDIVGSIGIYEIESELMLRQNLFHNGELTRDVISLKPHDIDDMDLFEIDCASELEDDARIILTADHAVVSGRALRELLSDAETACRIRDVCLRQQTWEQLRKTLEDWRCGRVQRLLAPIPRERFAQSLARLARELERIHGGEAMEQPAGNEQEATE